MALLTRRRSRAFRRSRDPRSWLDSVQPVDPASLAHHAKDDLAHARDDIADWARQLRSTAPDIARQVRTSGPDVARQIAATAPDVARQIRTSAADAAESLPSGRDVLKHVPNLVPPRRRRASRWPRVALAAAVVATVVGILAARAMRTRRSGLPMPIRSTWKAPGPARSTGSEADVPPGAGPAPALGSPSMPLSPAATQAPPDLPGLPPDATNPDPATFDRDAELRAATEGMRRFENTGPGVTDSE